MVMFTVFKHISGVFTATEVEEVEDDGDEDEEDEDGRRSCVVPVVCRLSSAVRCPVVWRRKAPGRWRRLLQSSGRRAGGGPVIRG